MKRVAQIAFAELILFVSAAEIIARSDWEIDSMSRSIANRFDSNGTNWIPRRVVGESDTNVDV